MLTTVVLFLLPLLRGCLPLGHVPFNKHTPRHDTVLPYLHFTVTQLKFKPSGSTDCESIHTVQISKCLVLLIGWQTAC